MITRANLEKELNRVGKFEIRSTKQYRSSNEQMTETWFQATGAFLVFVFVSDFVLRDSDFLS